MKRILLSVTMATVLVGGGWVAAQSGPTPKAPTTTPAPRGGMMGGDYGGYGMSNGMMGGGMCPIMIGSANVKIDVKKIEKGVTITLTSSDIPTAQRLQKIAEAMRLMHEAMSQ